MPLTAPAFRVVVRLPVNRPENPISDPPQVIWNTEKADLLWKVIEKSRLTDNGGADWKAMASYLQVPLPYLLYRVNARFQEEIRELKDIQGTLSPSASQPNHNTPEEFSSADRLTSGRGMNKMKGSSTRLSSSSSRFGTPFGVRARLNSLGQNAARPKKATSSSTLTLHAGKKASHVVPLRPTSPLSSEATDSDEEADALKEEENERKAEDQELLDRKLEVLQKMMTNDALGLVSGVSSKGKTVDRGRLGPGSSRSLTGSYRPGTLSSRSASQSISSASSRQGSIPDIPSPPLDTNFGKRVSLNKSSSPPTLSHGNAVGYTHQKYGRLVDRSSEQGSNQSSEASSFSDISDASVSASALESALLSNIRGTGTGSRISQFARSKLLKRSGL